MIKKEKEQSFCPLILIVDDNTQNLQVAGKLLQENNFEIEFATNGIAALEWLKSRQFDIVLLDINMPEMNGFEVCSKIRSDPSLNNMPVIFLSAASERESILKGFDLGAQDYVTKPFDSRELLARVKTHLALKKSLENLSELNSLLDEKVKERTQQLKEANEKLEILNLKLIDVDKSKAEFLSLISHEIRTPLNGIIGPMELLKGPVSAGELNELVEILDISVRRLEKFATDALLITRLKTKQVEIKKERTELSKIIDEAVSQVKEKIHTCGIKIKVTDETPETYITGESGLIIKGIGNIIENAISFSPPGGTIEIKTNVENHDIICEIKDEGIGFEPGLLKNEFKLFTTGSQYNDNCTGIGLPVVKMIMEAHGGDIIISNNPDGGASVKLIFR
ncbi:MAG: hypothetical protein C0408_05480 [Odoribacter sp.]|nr:hypothetical protein [Odoribacter sp.]